MSLLTAYLTKSSTQRVLNRKPGEKGFSLIELVVVVAVLAILAAIAIPSFTSINDKAKASGAANTIAQIAKECAVKDANNDTLIFEIPNLSGYAVTPALSSGSNAGKGDCTGGSANELVATSDTPAKYPTYIYNVDTGAKKCTHGAGAAAELHGCSKGTNGTW
tara:strand:- start:88 stop:576 length:489 start_codon:yes stop_codon:yes gene_type:complete